jgi:hypothetical protein
MIYSQKFLQAKTTTKFLPHFKFGSEELVKILHKHNKIEKVFPYIGLKNDIEFEKTHIIADENGKDCEMHIGFSSDGVCGIWDIGTMSVRGVSSCMHFENPHSKHIVGSMVDPFAGIIYLTNLKPTKYGITYNKRAIVRLVISTDGYGYSDKWGNPRYILWIERIYAKTCNTNPMIYDNKDSDDVRTISLFRDYIKRKVLDQSIMGEDRKFPAIYYIPSPICSDLPERFKSFSDLQLKPYPRSIEQDYSAILRSYKSLMEKQL